MKFSPLLVLNALLLAGSAHAAAASSSLTLQYGPAYPSPSSVTSRTQPAYDFAVDQFWHPNANTFLSITVTEHIEQTTFISGPDFICACVSFYSPPQVSTFSFGLPSAVAGPVDYQIYNGFETTAFSFSPTIDNMWPIGGLSTVRIGEMETTMINGVETLTRFAADFTLQFGELSFVEVVDPETGFNSFTQVFSAYPDNWLAGSLRYQSDTAAFAYLAPVPEPLTYLQMLAGLAVLGELARRRSRGHFLA